MARTHAFRRGTGLALAAITLVAAPSALATEPGWTADPPPPTALTDAAVDAWVKENLVLGRDLQTGYNSKVVGFISTERLELPEPNLIRVWVRFEIFQTAVAPGVRVGSFRTLTDFDCRQGRHRELAHEFFPLHNLAGVPVKDAHPDAPWQVDRAEGVWSVNARVLCAARDMALESGGGAPAGAVAVDRSP